MKAIAGIMLVLALTITAPALFAQEEHGEIGVFADYTRLHHANDRNFWGPGVQLSFNMGRFAQLEASMAYDLEQTFTSTSTPVIGGTSTSTFTTQNGLRLLHGLFGPRFQTGVGPVKAFIVLKGGFLNFRVNNQGAANGFATQFNGLTSGDTNGVFYPGGGIEFGGHRIGIRLEAGDEMYFDRGANHNLKIQAGPTFKF
ncbi:MAG: hypothetical protein JO187_13615 [Acidobacteria bacterium]|nr:hypothetical protein [Acidobacteriaceae bacterium]MBV9610594.1 hypothetical protein [Acidobacteriota bacterium]